jgi:hypothetical protein
MGIFSGKKGKVVDLTETYGKRRPVKKASSSSQAQSSDSEYGPDTVGYLGEMMGAAKKDYSDSEDNETSGEKKKKLAKRILDMTDRIEDLSNQIYHLQQRIDLLERKANGRNFE